MNVNNVFHSSDQYFYPEMNISEKNAVAISHTRPVQKQERDIEEVADVIEKINHLAIPDVQNFHLLGHRTLDTSKKFQEQKIRTKEFERDNKAQIEQMEGDPMSDDSCDSGYISDYDIPMIRF